MEANSLKTEKNSKILVTNLNQIHLSGVSKVFSATESCISLCLADKNMTIDGKNMQVLKIDVECGIVEVEGQVFGIKLEKRKSEKNFFKRIFS